MFDWVIYQGPLQHVVFLWLILLTHGKDRSVSSLSYIAFLSSKWFTAFYWKKVVYSFKTIFMANPFWQEWGLLRYSAFDCKTYLFTTCLYDTMLVYNDFLCTMDYVYLGLRIWRTGSKLIQTAQSCLLQGSQLCSGIAVLVCLRHYLCISMQCFSFFFL